MYVQEIKNPLFIESQWEGTRFKVIEKPYNDTKIGTNLVIRSLFEIFYPSATEKKNQCVDKERNDQRDPIHCECVTLFVVLEYPDAKGTYVWKKVTKGILGRKEKEEEDKDKDEDYEEKEKDTGYFGFVFREDVPLFTLVKLVAKFEQGVIMQRHYSEWFDCEPSE